MMIQKKNSWKNIVEEKSQDVLGFFNFILHSSEPPPHTINTLLYCTGRHSTKSLMTIFTMSQMGEGKFEERYYFTRMETVDNFHSSQRKQMESIRESDIVFNLVLLSSFRKISNLYFELNTKIIWLEKKLHRNTWKHARPAFKLKLEQTGWNEENWK